MAELAVYPMPEPVLNVAPDDAAQLEKITDLSSVALLVIDAQAEFSKITQRFGKNGTAPGTEETESASRTIGALTPVFRAAGAQVYAVYCVPLPWHIPVEAVAFHGFEYAKGDIPIHKRTNSAFSNTPMDAHLQHSKKKSLFLCGFNTNACVMKTALDARKKDYDVYILSDMTGNGWISTDVQNTRGSVKEMQEAGVKFVRAQSALRHLRSLSS